MQTVENPLQPINKNKYIGIVIIRAVEKLKTLIFPALNRQNAKPGTVENLLKVC